MTDTPNSEPDTGHPSPDTGYRIQVPESMRRALPKNFYAWTPDEQEQWIESRRETNRKRAAAYRKTNDAKLKSARKKRDGHRRKLVAQAIESGRTIPIPKCYRHRAPLDFVYYTKEQQERWLKQVRAAKNESQKKYARKKPHKVRGYGSKFRRWQRENSAL